MKLFALLAATAAVALPAAASAATVVDFNAGNVTAPGQLAYAPGFTQYNQGGVAGPATVAGVSFAGTSGVDFGPFGFTTNGTPRAFLQSFPGLTTGNFTLTGLNLVANQSYTLTFANVVRNGNAFSFDISQGGASIANVTADSAFTTRTVTFVSNGNALTFASANIGGPDASAAIDDIAVSAVPEAATWAMMLAGFGMIGFALRRRAKTSVRVTYA